MLHNVYWIVSETNPIRPVWIEFVCLNWFVHFSNTPIGWQLLDLWVSLFVVGTNLNSCGDPEGTFEFPMKLSQCVDRRTAMSRSSIIYIWNFFTLFLLLCIFVTDILKRQYVNPKIRRFRSTYLPNADYMYFPRSNTSYIIISYHTCLSAPFVVKTWNAILL